MCTNLALFTRLLYHFLLVTYIVEVGNTLLAMYTLSFTQRLLYLLFSSYTWFSSQQVHVLSDNRFLMLIHDVNVGAWCAVSAAGTILPITPVHVNALRTGDADLRFYITTVQDR